MSFKHWISMKQRIYQVDCNCSFCNNVLYPIKNCFVQKYVGIISDFRLYHIFFCNWTFHIPKLTQAWACWAGRWNYVTSSSANSVVTVKYNQTISIWPTSTYLNVQSKTRDANWWLNEFEWWLMIILCGRHEHKEICYFHCTWFVEHNVVP